jgi:GTP-binding protein HflX
LRLPREQEVIINDTVGFIRDLPPDLISAFRATLEEISGSSLLIHAVDISNARWPQQIRAVKSILADLQLSEIPTILAFNKTDLVDQETLDAALRQVQTEATDVIGVSAISQGSLTPLLEKAGAILARNLARPSHHDDRRSFAIPHLA